MPPSSRGPGRSPFKAKTGVRISLGAPGKARKGFFILKKKTRDNTEYVKKNLLEVQLLN